MQMASIKVDAGLSRAQMTQYIAFMSEVTKKAHNKLWSRVARKPNTTVATTASNYLIAVNSSDIIIVSNSYLASPITDSPKATPLSKAITNLSKARASHYFLKDRVESLRDNNLNESESDF